MGNDQHDNNKKNDKKSTSPPAGRREPPRHSCGSRMIEVHMVIDDEPLTMTACSPCDVRSWHRRGVLQPLATILADLSATDTRYRRDFAVTH